MEKKILKFQLTNSTSIYPTTEEAENYDLFINRYGNVYNRSLEEIHDFKFPKFDKRKVLTIFLVGKEENALLEQILTIQQIDIIKYLYNYMGSTIKFISDVVKDRSLFTKIVSQKL